MTLSVIAILDRMAAADGIPITRTNTGVPTDSIRDFDSATSYLATMITPPNHTDEDHDIVQPYPKGAGFELELADEAGIDSPPALHGPYEAGGVPQIPQNFNNHLAGPDTHAVHAEPQPDGDEYGGAIEGGWQSNEADTGEHQDGTGGGRDESGSYTDQNGGDDTTGHDAYEEADSEGQSTPVPVGPVHPIHLPGARVLEYFRRGGTDIALMNREIMGHLGENAETAMNITVREAIRTRGQDAERVEPDADQAGVDTGGR
jgi:hypothetical protein